MSADGRRVTKKGQSLSEQNIAMYRFLYKATECVGANVFRPNYRVTWLTYLVMLVILVFYILTIYTIYVALNQDQDWVGALSALCYCGAAIQLANALIKRDLFCVIHFWVLDIFKEYEHHTGEFRQSLVRALALNKRIIFLLLQVNFVTVNSFVLYPLMYGEPIMQFIIPGLDTSTKWGYVCVQAVHSLCIFFGAFGNFASDIFCYTTVASITLLKDILKNKFDVLERLVMKYPRNEMRTLPTLLDVIKWHQSYIDFSDKTNSAFFWVIFVQMAMSTMSIICTIVCLFFGSFPVAKIFLVYCFVLLYCYCALGNLVDISNEEVIDMIYSFMWYDMSLREQKMILTMLHRSQLSQGMTIGGVSPLSLHTALQLTKTIYSIAMLLHKSLE